LAASEILHLFVLITVFLIAIKICKPWGPYSTTNWYTWRWPRRLKHVGVIKYIGDTWICTSLVVSLDNLAKICRFNYFINPIITTKQWPSSFQQSHCHNNQLPGSRNQRFIIAHTKICQRGPSWDSSPPSQLLSIRSTFIFHYISFLDSQMDIFWAISSWKFCMHWIYSPT
jgi:hypothetical protein